MHHEHYHCRSLSASSNEDRTGSMLLHHPHTDDQNYRFVDKSFKEQCCGIESDDHCEIFYNRRVINDCNGYITLAELELQRQISVCLDSLFFEEQFLFGIGQTRSELATLLYPCPCTKQQAQLDNKFEKQIGSLYQCYVSTVPVYFNGLLFTYSLTQQCCYNAETG